MLEAVFSGAAALVWLILAIIFLVAEALTVTLISVWFAIGAILAMIAAIFGGALWLQILIFIAASGVLVLATKPISEKLINKRTITTNADRVVGKPAIVTITISNQAAQGQVRVLDQLWTARSLDDAPIAVGSAVEVMEIQGVKLIVKPLTDNDKEE